MLINGVTGNVQFKAPPIPDGCDWPELTGIVGRIEKLVADYQATTRRARELSDGRRAAKAEDTAAFAEAIAGGRKDPGTRHSDKLEAEIREAERRRDALRIAIGNLGPELLAAIEAGREGWLREARAGREAASVRLEEARAVVRKAEAEVMQHDELMAWLVAPNDYKPGRATKSSFHKAPRVEPPSFVVIGGRPAANRASTPQRDLAG